MRITVFTGNQPRHLALIDALARHADIVFAVQECNTVFPGRVDDFFRKSPVMREYFRHVISAESLVFGRPGFSAENVRTLSLKTGDLSRVERAVLAPALSSDLYVVFGASYIQGALCEHLVENGAVNIHMGVAPYYRGSSTNFWALHDCHPELVGATIHRLSTGLDSGPILRHAFPEPRDWEPFELGMRAVQAAHDAVVELLRSGELDELTAIPQDRSFELRYTCNADFTDDVAAVFLNDLPRSEAIRAALLRRDPARFVRPFVPRAGSPRAAAAC